MRQASYVVVVLVSAIVVAHVWGDTELISVQTKDTIVAGDGWELFVEIANGEPGDELPVSLVNGLQLLQTTLTLGSGGVAVWRIPEGEITQAGVSQYVVQYGEDVVQRPLTVLPGAPDTADLFSTANAVAAYGEGSASILALPRDEWGNAVSEDVDLQLTVQYPDASEETVPFSYLGGLGRYLFTSHGQPGRVQLTLEQDQLQETLEIFQVPAEPAQVLLSVAPACVPTGGRDVVSLIALVMDSEDVPVVDGTLVVFEWEGGRGYGQTIEGQTTLRLPAPTEVGQHAFWASASAAGSSEASLLVTDEVCREVG